MTFTREQIIAMAREAGIEWQGGFVRVAECVTQDELERFAALIEQAARADERERCAKVCEVEARQHEHLDRNGRSRHLDDAAIAKTCAAAIRALKEQA